MVAGAASACGAAQEGSTGFVTTVVVKAVPTPDVHTHYTISLTCGATDALTGKGIAAPDGNARTACAFLHAHPSIFTTQHTCMTIDGGSAAVTETLRGKTIRSCIGGMMGTGVEGRLLRLFQGLILGRR
jgi:hypothetical protein